jgi:hypothetical protein
MLTYAGVYYAAIHMSRESSYCCCMLAVHSRIHCDTHVESVLTLSIRQVLNESEHNESSPFYAGMRFNRDDPAQRQIYRLTHPESTQARGAGLY